MNPQKKPQLIDVDQVSSGWINKYVLHYEMPDASPYTYESVSRKSLDAYRTELASLGSGKAPHADAVCIVPLLEDGSVLLIREFRYPLNSWCVSLPAGLVDAGESIQEAVVRELHEETGFRVRSGCGECGIRPLAQPGFSSTGMAEENVHVVFAQVEPDSNAHPEKNELIEPFVLKRTAIRGFLDANTLPIGTRCQLVLELLAQTAEPA